MPTFEAHDRFWHEYDALGSEQQALFRQARRDFVGILLAWERERLAGAPRFPSRLGVTPMVNHRGIMEFAWAGDGRCTWEYGMPQVPGRFHVIWRRIGTHAIYENP